MQKKWNPRLNLEELTWLRNNGFHIGETWISPMEGYDYFVVPFGGGGIGKKGNKLFWAKSPRACFNWVKRHLTTLAHDGGTDTAKSDNSVSDSNPDKEAGSHRRV